MATEQLVDVGIDELSPDDEAYSEYSLTSYPSDFTLAVLYDQWNNGDIVVPDYQRGYVWTIEQASKLMESFLIGLPIPQIFLYVDDDHKLLVIDGQQRITSVAYFLEGFFGEEANGNRKVFRLTGLSDKSPFAKKAFADLDAATQRKLKGAPLRAINIRQLRPEADNTSVYQIFERLNTGGTPLKPQEIRNAVYRGPFNEALKSLNKFDAWRRLLGKAQSDKHMRDVELLVRVFALTYFRDKYDGKMKNFLTWAMRTNRDGKSDTAMKFLKSFAAIAEHLFARLGPDPFRRGGPINSAMLEAVFCVCLQQPERTLKAPLDDGFRKLLEDGDFDEAISQTTNTVERVRTRFDRAMALLFSDA
jgi:hypothetical protein